MTDARSRKGSKGAHRGVGANVSPKKNAPRREDGVTPRPHKASAAQTRRKSSATRKRALWLRKGFWSFTLSSIFVCFLFAAGLTLYFASDLPSIANLESAKRQPGITIKTEDGITLASYGDVYGDYIAFEKIPKHLVYAVMATEDRRFFDHSGIDVLGILRAMITNLRAGKVVQGGSTITQQVAKNVFLSPDRTLKRKVQEMLLAFWLEAHFSKEQIMAIYLNRVYLGSGNYGIDAASRRYFDKPATEVNLVEAAILTGLLKAPTRYSPLSSTERARQRAHQVLLNMADAGYLKADDVDAALAQFQDPKLYREGDASGTRYFTDWLTEELPLYIGEVSGDVTVISTLSPKLQAEAEDAVNKVMDAKTMSEKLATQAALVSMTPDGAVQAMVGGRSYQESQYNRAVQAIRQPGSVFKLFVYLAALEAGATPDMLVEDQPLAVPDHGRTWRPTNFDNQYRGTITLREALTHSLNTIAVQLSMTVGLEKVVEMAQRLGISGVPENPSIALGAVDTTLLDLTTAYAHLANQGRGVQPYGIRKIIAQDGKLLYEREGSGLWVVLREQVVRQMNYMLMNVPLAGTGQRAYIGRPMAGKTGTSSDFRDAWFIGYTAGRVTGVWVGNDDNSQMKKVTGGNLPAMIWNSFMSVAEKDEPVRGLAGADGDFSDSALPWQLQGQQQGGQGGVLDLFRSGEPKAPEGAPAQRGPDLSPSFWDQLFGDEKRDTAPAGKVDAPATGQPRRIEYDYPTSSPRERRLER